MSAPAVTDHLAIALRAYAAPQFSEVRQPSKQKPKRKASKVPPSPWAVIFDTETTTDAGQALRFGTYQVRKAGELYEEGIFFDPEGMTPEELTTLRTYANEHKLELLTRDQFADQVFYRIGYLCRATTIGFNLPFDISRIAIAHNSARTEMRGGFTFRLSHQKIFPHVQVRHRSSRSAFIRFAAPMRRPEDRSEAKRGGKSPHRAGHFLDLRTLAGALFARSFSLASLSAFLDVPNPKLEFDEFEGPVTEEMVRYAVRDVQTTWECYVELRERFDRLDLASLTPEKVFSEASIGKGYLKDMGIAPWRKVQPGFPAQMLANIMGTYFGGRSEVRIRRELKQVILCDFLSMYPTVCVLMSLWRYVIAQGVEWRDETAEARQLLHDADLCQLQSPLLWRKLTMLVRVKADADVFPVRANYSDEAQTTIGTNCLSADETLWFTLADCIAAKLLTGKAPEIIEAVAFSPGPLQRDLQPININGNPAYRLDPAKSDFFERVIELRQSIKRASKAATGAEKAALDIAQNALKIAANATSYGIYVEVNVAKRPKRVATTVHSSTCQPFSFRTDKAEEPGPFFHPLLATLITGAARLMLATAERLVKDHGLEWCFCDTDSIAIARPDDVSAEEFESRTREIVAWFTPLNPYDFAGPILKIEDENFSFVDPTEWEPLYCWAVSAKRYALFNLTAAGELVMRKISEHGLGHLIAPYRSELAPTHIPAPHPSVLKKGLGQRWQHDLWWHIVCAAFAGHADRVDLDYHPALAAPAISRYGATTPELLRWFNRYNAKRPYRQQVKPFGFLYSLQAALPFGDELIVTGSKRQQRRSKPIKPIALFDRDLAKAVETTFDRDSGRPVRAHRLKSYAEALSSYHLHPESKFLSGDYLDRGTTRRRHVRAATVQHIGKEANDWERQAVLGLSADDQPTYGVGDADPALLSNNLRPMMQRWGVARCAMALGVSAATLRSLIDQPERISERTLQVLAARLPEAKLLFERVDNNRRAENEALRAAVNETGLRSAARQLGVDASNLRRKIRLSSIKFAETTVL
jgi:hypothetical protein